MKSQIIIVLLIIIFFCGCTELNNETTNTTEDTNENTNNNENSESEQFELLYYTVETFDTGIPWDPDDDQSIGKGFISNESADYYQIIGRIKNKSGDNATIDITMTFYDTNNGYLGTYDFTMNDIPDTYERSFSIRIDQYDIDYFNEIQYLSFNMVKSL